MCVRLVLIVILGCSHGQPRDHAEGDECNPTNAIILGGWARPQLDYINAQGDASPASGWRAELWLPDGPHLDGCRFSCASTRLSAVVTANGPASFVLLSHPTEGARPLVSADATLSVAGAAPRPQTAMRNDRFEPYEASAYHQSYFFAFPPTNPPNWDYLEVTVPIEGSADWLRARFTRER